MHGFRCKVLPRHDIIGKKLCLGVTRVLKYLHSLERTVCSAREREPGDDRIDMVHPRYALGHVTDRGDLYSVLRQELDLSYCSCEEVPRTQGNHEEVTAAGNRDDDAKLLEQREGGVGTHEYHHASSTGAENCRALAEGAIELASATFVQDNFLV